MATLPTITERPGASPSLGVASVNPSPTNLGGALVQAGGEIERAGQIVARYNYQQDQMVAQNAANQLQAAALELHQNKDSGFIGVKGQRVVGQAFVDEWTKRFDDAKAKVGDGLTSETQKRVFEQHADALGLRYRSSLLQYQAHQTDIFNDQTEKDTIDLARRQIFSGDPADASFAKIDWALEQRGRRLGWSDQTLAGTKMQYRASVYDDVTSIMVENDPRGSLSLLTKRLQEGRSGHDAVDSLSPDKLIALRRRAFAYVNAEDNEAQREADKRLKEAEKVTEEFRKFSLSGGMPSVDYENRIKASVAGTPFEPIANVLIAQATLGAAHGTQTLPRQQVSLRNMQAQMAGGASPEALAVLQQATQITANQEKAFKENPWAAWTQFGRGPAAPEEAPSAQLVSKRVQLMGGLETQTGFPVSPLQPNEAALLSEQLKRLQPKEAGDLISAIGGQLTAPRIEALAEQLDKSDRALGLALKAGFDKTNAGRSLQSFILTGRQALQDKTVKLDEEKANDRKREIAELIRGTLGPEGSKAEQDAIDMAWYVRAGLDIMEPAADFKLKTTNKKAVELVIGLPLERAGVKTILPKGMDESQFDERLGGYTPEKLRALVPSGVVYVRGQPRTLEQLSGALQSLGMKRDGAGRYVPVSGGAFVTLDPEGATPLRLPL